jgi:hypothetical protein
MILVRLMVGRMKELNFYKYFENTTQGVHFWETEDAESLTKVDGLTKEIKNMFATSNTQLIDMGNGYYKINVKLYNNEDNALFCLLVGGK